MTYLNCTRCRLSIEQRRGRPALQECPRCLSRRGETVPLFRSPLPLRLLGEAPRGQTGAGRSAGRAVGSHR